MTSENKCRKQIVSCSQCGKEHERTIITSARDGKDYPAPSSTSICQECYDNKRHEEYKQGKQKELEETIEKQRDRWYQQYGIQGIFAEKTFSNFHNKLQPKTFKMLKEWDYGKSIIIYSPDSYGVGKTHLVSALANYLVENKNPASILESRGNIYIQKHDCPVYFITEPIMLARIRRTFENNHTETEDDIYKQLTEAPLLILDDVGKVRPRDYSFLQGVYYRVIDERYVQQRDIILTTNLNLEELETHIGGACADRLREMCGKEGMIKMVGKSYRRDSGIQ